MKMGRRNEIGEREDERNAGAVGDKCHELTLEMSMAYFKVSEGTQLAGGKVCKDDTGDQLHKIMGILEYQEGQGI